MPQKWSSFFKKIHCIFRHIRGGGGGQTRYDICHIFFFFEGVPYYIIGSNSVTNTAALHPSFKMSDFLFNLFPPKLWTPYKCKLGENENPL